MNKDVALWVFLILITPGLALWLLAVVHDVLETLARRHRS